MVKSGTIRLTSGCLANIPGSPLEIIQFSCVFFFTIAYIILYRMGLELKFFGVDGGFSHSPGSIGLDHLLYTIVPSLGSYCKFSTLVSLLDNHMGVRSTRVRTICSLHTLNQPSPSLEPMTYQNQRP